MLALANAAAEWCYTRGLETNNLVLCVAASKLFPFDYRYRHAPAELVVKDGNPIIAVPLLRAALRDDPYNVVFNYSLMLYGVALGDQEMVSQQFALLYRLAPRSQAMRELLKRRRMDP